MRLGFDGDEVHGKDVMAVVRKINRCGWRQEANYPDGNDTFYDVEGEDDDVSMMINNVILFDNMVYDNKFNDYDSNIWRYDSRLMVYFQQLKIFYLCRLRC